MAETAVAGSSKPKVTLHWLDQSRSQRVFWILEECKGIDYDVKIYKRMPSKLAPPSLKSIHPLGKSPVITIESADMKEPLVLAESAFLMEYLVQYFAPHLAPKQYQAGKEGQLGGETEQYLRYRFYMHYVEGSLMTFMVIALIFDQMIAQAPWIGKLIVKEIVRRVYEQFLSETLNTHFSFLDQQLATSPEGGKYLCGKDITAADILMSYALIAGKSKIDAQSYPHVVAYTELLEDNEVFKRSITKLEKISGEPFTGAMPR